MDLTDCHNVANFHRLAHKRLPGPIFHYTDGAADDEVSRRRNTEAFGRCDLVPNVLAGVEEVDISTTVMGERISMPLMLSSIALQRLFHWHSERGFARVAEQADTRFGISSRGTVSIAEIGWTIATPEMFQIYVNKDRVLKQAMIAACKAAKFDAIALTVDTIVSGNREGCKRTGLTSPPKPTLASAPSFALHPARAINCYTRGKFGLSNLKDCVSEAPNIALSVSDYSSTMRNQSIDWNTAAAIRRRDTKLMGMRKLSDPNRAKLRWRR